MPSSTKAGKNKVAKWINSQITSSNFKIIDLGCGKGTYGKLISEPCYKVAVDAMPYKDKFKLLDIYDEFHQFDIRDCDKIEELGSFDLAIMGDVLEHLYTEEARKVIDTLKKNVKKILVAVPFKYWQMGLLNHYENHLQPDLTPEIFMERYPEFKLFSIHTTTRDPWNGEPFYGYYIWENEI